MSKRNSDPYAILRNMNVNMNAPINWHKQHKENLSIGERAADKMRNGMGSWTFVLSFMVFLGLWATANSIDTFSHWDKYPFILLNLFLSMLAALQGAILLIAAKRQDAINAVMAQNDYQTNKEAKKEVEELMAIHARQLKMIQELLDIAKDKK